MKAIVFLGDEAHAAACRLAGLTVRVPEPGREAEAFAGARAEAAVLLVGARCAARLPPGTLAAAAGAGQPPVLVLPERSGELPPGDPASAVRRLLGLAP